MSAKTSGGFTVNGIYHPVIELGKNGEKFCFTFGVYKARLIVAHIAEIQKFVEDNKDY